MSVDFTQVTQRNAALKIAQDQMEQTTTAQNVQMLIQITANRNALLGEHGSAKSASLVDAADKLLLKWVNGLEGKNDDG